MMHTDTYIDKQEANAIKAIALLLVIWGHNHYLTPLGSSFGYWIYAFHVVTFFILPIFYEPKKETFSAYIKKLTARCIIPYTIFYVLCILLAFIANKINILDFSNIIKGYFKWGGVTAKDATGFQFIWFIPCYYTFSIIRYWGIRYRIINLFILLIGFYLIFIGDGERAYFHKISPFYISQAILYYTLGMIAFYLYSYINHFKWIGVFIFFISSIIFFIDNFSNNSIIVAISGFFSIWCISQNVKKLKIIQYLGINSFVIYILNVYVYVIINYIFSNSLISQLICYLSTIVLCLILTNIINKSKLKFLLFPRSFSDFKKVWSNA